MTKTELAERIRRNLGSPMVKVELDTSQIWDNIDYARSKYIKWAVGNATQETYFTMALSAGQNFYDMPVGITEIVSYDSTGISSGINTLFTIDNFLYNQGMYEAMLSTQSSAYTMVSYHIARDFLDMIRRYTPDKYNWKYHRYSNELEIQPAPVSGNSLSITYSDGSTGTIDSPGFVLIKAYMMEGSSYDNWEDGDTDADFYTSSWILDHATASCKITLGMIRRKFANFGSIGNMGISMDGDSLVSEGKEEKERLEEALKLEESYIGYPILIG